MVLIECGGHHAQFGYILWILFLRFVYENQNKQTNKTCRLFFPFCKEHIW